MNPSNFNGPETCQPKLMEELHKELIHIDQRLSSCVEQATGSLNRLCLDLPSKGCENQVPIGQNDAISAFQSIIRPLQVRLDDFDALCVKLDRIV